MAFLKTCFLEINIFESTTNDTERTNEQELHSNRIATRIYFLILILCLVIFGSIFWLRHQITLEFIEYPIIDQFESLPIDANCPCSHSSLGYGEFISLEITFHQVCSSEFVSDRWIKTLHFGLNSTYFHINDIRTYGSAQFQALAGFCRLTKTNVYQNILLFNQTLLISPQVITKDIFQSQISSIIEQFQLNLPITFLSQLQLIREITRSNRLLSGLQTNLFFTFNNVIGQSFQAVLTRIGYISSNGSQCNCYTTIDCIGPSIILDSFDESNQLVFNQSKILMEIPGFLSGCLPVNNILLSTLECFYNQTCLNQLLFYLSSNETFTAMNTFQQSQFHLDSTIQTLLNNLMIENWIKTISFVLEKLLSLLKGLTIILGFFIPRIVRYIQRKRHGIQTPKVSFCNRLYQLKDRLIKKLLNMNIYINNSTDQQEIQYEIYATRIYIVLLILSLIIVAMYTLLIKEIHRKIIQNPTEFEYIQLEEIYFNSLSCPCQSTSIAYRNILNFDVQYHQICSSDFLSNEWIDYTTYSSQSIDLFYYVLDFRNYVTIHFQSLLMFCQQAKQTFEYNKKNFLQTQLINSQLLSPNLFETEINVSIEIWQTNLLNQFTHTIQFILATTRGNQLINEQNVAFYKNSDVNKFILIQLLYNDCFCGFNQSCYSSMSIYNKSESYGYYPLYTIPNFNIGCFLIDALLTSTLECFYNFSCLYEIDKYMWKSLGELFHFNPLNSNLNSPNETIEIILNRLMIDKWIINKSFSSYYKTCAPLSCTIEYIGYNDILFVLITITGLFGSLSFIWKIFIWIILKLIITKKNRIYRLNFKHFIKNIFIVHDEYGIIQRISILLVISILCILYLFLVLTYEVNYMTIDKPSLDIYQNLFQSYSKSLQCLCKHFSIQYQTFLDIKYHFHQICSSDFISDRWIEYIYSNTYYIYLVYPRYFTYSTSGQFQLLQIFCQLSHQFVNDTFLQLLTSYFINIQLLSFDTFHQRIQMQINQSQLEMSYLFTNILSLIRETTHANMLMTAFASSWTLINPLEIISDSTIHTKPQIYQECYCSLSSKCIESYKDMYVGCYSLETLFQSTFQCYYNQQCIDKTNRYQAMNTSIKSRFDFNTTIEDILNHLMIEEYFNEISYENYFNQCSPLYCSYSLTKKKTFIQCITFLLEIYGGLFVICYCVAVLLVKICFYRKQIITPTTRN
ncbi:unnamed protein product [Adineta ricciae]|uniref:Transmembrane protein n=1 Tax=Adineta ricciae TaxID=249248 RepID=A0A815XH75_ADIRI|nr:unnamed protein product [Adineta ricciae]